MRERRARSGAGPCEDLLVASRALLDALEREVDVDSLAAAHADRRRAFEVFEGWVRRAGRAARLPADFRSALRSLDLHIEARAQGEMEAIGRERAKLGSLRRGVSAHHMGGAGREARFVALRA